MGMTKTQTATLETIRALTANGPLDVTYGGIKGVNRSSLWCLEEAGVVNIERTTENGRLKMMASVA
jgi:hypothetical protein